MRVKELKKILAGCNDDMPVMFNGNGYRWDIQEGDIVIDTKTQDLTHEDDESHIDPPVLLIRL